MAVLLMGTQAEGLRRTPDFITCHEEIWRKRELAKLGLEVTEISSARVTLSRTQSHGQQTVGCEVSLCMQAQDQAI